MVNQQQAFPAGSGPLDRTTYMFTYIDPQPTSPKLEDLLEDYWDLMPKYQVNFYYLFKKKKKIDASWFWSSSTSTQEVSLDDLEILRVIYGIFPTYRDR